MTAFDLIEGIVAVLAVLCILDALLSRVPQDVLDDIAGAVFR